MRLQRLRLLHISDLHFGDESDEFDATRVLEHVAEHFRHTKPRVQLVAITGDITHHSAKQRDVADAIAALRKLKSVLGLSDTSFLFVPGNHDIRCGKKVSKSLNWRRYRRYIAIVNAVIAPSGEGSTRVRWPQANLSITGSRRPTLLMPHPLGTYRVILGESLNPQSPVDFILLNSVVGYGPKGGGIGITKRQASWLESLQDYLKSRARLKVALVHNPPLSFRASSKTFSNAGRMLLSFARSGVGVLLHGDLHYSQHAAASRALGDNSTPLYMLGAGQSGNEPGEVRLHLLDFSVVKEATAAYAEVEVKLFTPRGANGPLECLHDSTLQLCLPTGLVSDAKASIHLFELPQAHLDRCKDRMAKDLLLALRANTFSFLTDRTKSLLANGQCGFAPQDMYSLFYDSVFSYAQPGDSFYATHGVDWRVWLLDETNLDLLKKHKRAADRGVEIRRLIILPPGPNASDRQDLLKLCLCLQSDENRAPFFRTHFVRKSDVASLYSKAAPGEAADPCREVEHDNVAVYVRRSAPKGRLGFFFKLVPGTSSAAGENAHQAVLTIHQEVTQWIEQLANHPFDNQVPMKQSQELTTAESVAAFWA